MENSVEKKKGFTKRGQPSVGTDAQPHNCQIREGRKEFPKILLAKIKDNYNCSWSQQDGSVNKVLAAKV